MIDDLFKRVTVIGGALAAAVAVATLFAGIGVGAGVLVGGVWNLLSLWCLIRLLEAWIGPNASRRRAIPWAFVKFPALYLLAYAAFHIPGLSVVGFTIGFTVVLAAAVLVLALSLQRLVAHPRKAHGR